MSLCEGLERLERCFALAKPRAGAAGKLADEPI